MIMIIINKLEKILFRLAAFSICKSDLKFKMFDGEKTIMNKIITWMYM